MPQKPSTPTEEPADKRSRKTAIVAHCILNQNARAQGIAKRPNAIAEVTKFLLQNHVGLVQMPCPEMAYAGLPRKTRTKQEYDKPSYRRKCRTIAEETIYVIRRYLSGQVAVKVVLGVEGSPSCGISDPGILVEELQSSLKRNGISVPFLEVGYEMTDELLSRLREIVKS